MCRIVLACAAFLMFIGDAAAQTESPYCIWMKGQIARIQKSLNGLQQLVGGGNCSLLSCNPAGGETPAMARARCDAMNDSLGTWHDYETQTTYVIFTRDWVRSYAQNRGASAAGLARSFAKSDEIRDKIARGGAVMSLELELQRWMADYRAQCGGGRPQAEGTGRTGRGLLNVPGLD